MTAVLDRRLRPARPDLADERLRGLVEAARFATGVPRRVTAGVAPLRRAPSSDAPLDTEAQLGDDVLVFEEADGWAWAQLAADGYVGYLPAAALGLASHAPTHRVRALRSFLYPAPDMKRPPLGFAGLGARVAVVETRDGYARTEAGAWLHAGHLAPVGDVEPDFVAVAERLLGTPYLWGGRTTLGLDCSGLVQLALDAAGISAPRDSDLQAAGLGDPLAPGAALRRGDLVFWRGHVGVMTDGETLLHANAWRMAVAAEPLAEACARIEAAGGGAATGMRRLRR